MLCFPDELPGEVKSGQDIEGMLWQEALTR